VAILLAAPRARRAAPTERRIRVRPVAARATAGLAVEGGF
jgi:hypothetical protein